MYHIIDMEGKHVKSDIGVLCFKYLFGSNSKSKNFIT